VVEPFTINVRNTMPPVKNTNCKRLIRLGKLKLNLSDFFKKKERAYHCSDFWLQITLNSITSTLAKLFQ
jgi:hypothetical protein